MFAQKGHCFYCNTKDVGAHSISDIKLEKKLVMLEPLENTLYHKQSAGAVT